MSASWPGRRSLGLRGPFEAAQCRVCGALRAWTPEVMGGVLCPGRCYATAGRGARKQRLDDDEDAARDRHLHDMVALP